MPVEKILFHPLFGKNAGSGHLRRCIEWSKRLYPDNTPIFKDIGFSGNYYAEKKPDNTSENQDNALFSEEWKNRAQTEKLPIAGFRKFFVVFDCRFSTKKDLLPWSEWATPVLIDDDGPARLLAPFVLDIIPGPRGTEANQKSSAWLELPHKSRNPDPEGKILISFGGEDPAGITIPLVHGMVKQLRINPDRIHVTMPAHQNVAKLPENINIVSKPTNLKSILPNFGLVITSYGLTLWEAIGAGCAVITISPSPSHHLLVRSTGVPSIGLVKNTQKLGRHKIRRLAKLLSRTNYLIKKANSLRQEHWSPPGDITSLFNSLDAPCAWCAACRYNLPPVIFRFPAQSYYRCPLCGIIGQYRFRLSLGEYDHHYFYHEYAKKYGRSYMKDFESIKARAVPRLKYILKRSETGGRLLDIGCAFGPFLQAAREKGFRPYGTDISPEAVDYVRNSLGIPAAQGNFPESYMMKFGDGKTYNIITLWYVIEHFPDLGTALLSINSLLKKNGVLAISTPNFRGISGLLSLKKFLQNSPADHYTIWSPRSCRRLLKVFRMRVYKIRITGHHPERFPLGKVKILAPLLHPLFMTISRIFGLGDTFEAYAVKEKDI